VLAEAISGSEEQFAELMKRDGEETRPDTFEFQECHRLARSRASHELSRHRDAGLAHHPRLPAVLSLRCEKTFKYNNIEQGNRNPLVQRGTADGLKTGHTEAGGYGLVASTLRNNRRVILVLNGMATMHERSEEGERLMDWAFANFEDVTLFNADAVIERAPVWLGTEASVPLVAAQELVLTMPAQLAADCAGEVALRRADPRAGREGRGARQAGGVRPGCAGGRVAAGGR